MINIIHKLKKVILLDMILFALAFFLVRHILNLFNLEFRSWIFYIFSLVIIISVIFGIIQLIRIIKIKWVKLVSFVLCAVLFISSIPFTLFLFAFSWQTEHIVYKDEYKLVGYVNSFAHTFVYYYDYKNLFLRGKNLRLREHYGEGGFDPIKYSNHAVKDFYWCDDDGSPIKYE